MYKQGGNRNFGYGKKLPFAGKMSLMEHFGGGHFSSVPSHLWRWKKFCIWLRLLGIKDAREVGLWIVEEYGRSLEAKVIEENLKVSYAQNLVSTVNVVLQQMRRDREVWISPSDAVGLRTHIRQEPPRHMNIESPPVY